MAEKKEKRIFYLCTRNGDELGPKYKSMSPSGAACKAAVEGHEEIWLHDKQMKRLYGYQGSIEQINDDDGSDNAKAFRQQYGMTKKGKAVSLGWKNV